METLVSNMVLVSKMSFFSFRCSAERVKIELPEPSVPAHVGEVYHPKYCSYHRVVHHPTSKCFSVKNIIQEYFDQGVIRRKTDYG